MAYELFCYSVQGASHIKSGIPCQDYGMKFENEDCKIFVLCDGHGDSNCPRSDYGSRSLCEIAVEELQVFAKIIDIHEDLEEKLMDKYGVDEIVNQLVTSIFGKWSCRVNEHFLQHPLTENEEAMTSRMLPLYKKGERIEHVYGTTFIAGVMTENYLLLLHQGDGKCVVFGSDGISTEPIPWDDRCVANVTTSVCDIDAVQSCRYHIIDLKKDHIIACVLGSDGIDDSFSSMNLMHSFYRRELLYAASNGIEVFEQHMADTFPDLSKNGSGDDTTVCGVIDRDAVMQHMQRFEEENERVIINNQISKAEERIISMEPKLDYLKKKCQDTDTEYSRIELKYAELKREYDEIVADVEAHERNHKNVIFFSGSSIKYLRRCLEKIKHEMDTSLRELQAIAVKKRACDDEYVAYKQKYYDYVKLKRECEEQLNNIGSAADDDTNASVTDTDNHVSADTDAVLTVTESAAEPVAITPSCDGESEASESVESGAVVIEFSDSSDTENSPCDECAPTEEKDASVDSGSVIVPGEAVSDMVHHDSQVLCLSVKDESAGNAGDS